jgi:hypothetical protein
MIPSGARDATAVLGAAELCGERAIEMISERRQRFLIC